jgi:predicted RNA binding protein YcfA (HicA-like mRNA interferase family)
MGRRPVCSGRDAVRAYCKIGYEIDHQTGSHIILRHPTTRRLTVPDHRELAKGTLRSLIREAGITKERFEELLSS